MYLEDAPAMYEALSSGQRLRSPAGTVYTVARFLGAGSQGEVYRVAAGGTDYAVKWYLPAFATAEQREAIETLVRAGPPSPAFLWPIELVENPCREGFGYAMPLRDPAVASIVDLMKGRVDPPFRALVTAALELVEAFRRLHAAGLCYKDISFGNVFFDPATGRVEVCDCDNVCVDGAARRVSVNGTPRFMAPEIVRNEAGPSVDTDLYSLAVLLFYMLTISHPLEGLKETAIHAFDAPAMRRLYGESPVFIFDPADASNRPDPAVHTCAGRYWALYPPFLRDLFVRSFTAGIREPRHGRVREGEWRDALLRLRDAIHYCPSCGVENFAGAADACWNCGAALRPPPRLVVDGRAVMLNRDTVLVRHHLDGVSWDLETVVARVARHPADPARWGLTNCTDGAWVAVRPDGSRTTVAPGRTVALAPGLAIEFGGARGEVEAPAETEGLKSSWITQRLSELKRR